mmetsp:Transcript_32965/g.72303  ORF Transcript_32965/g.72303 Transcript_32965/m.72303 type:complete len:245 (+) Transcript_32965:49-783(+)
MRSFSFPTLSLPSLLLACSVSFDASFHRVDAVRHSIKIGSAEKNSTYEWEDMNHYEILYLTSLSRQNDTAGYIINSDITSNHTAPVLPREERVRQRQAISTADVRKGYKIAAKLHHPDKVMGKYRQAQREFSVTGDGTLADGPFSYDELNARMARVVEAKEVLSDEEKRRRYDWYLLHFEENQERAKQYASDLGSKTCKYDDECSIESGQCCIKYHFQFCGDLSKYNAKALKCSGMPPSFRYSK